MAICFKSSFISVFQRYLMQDFSSKFCSTSPLLPLPLLTGELDANRPVPFRLTPSLQSLISPIGVTGPLQMSMVAASRCLVQPQYSLHSILRAILRDEFIAWCKVRAVSIPSHLQSEVWDCKYSLSERIE